MPTKIYNIDDLRKLYSDPAYQLWEDIFWGRVNQCIECKRKNMSCTNADCLKECEKMVKKADREEQTKLF